MSKDSGDDGKGVIKKVTGNKFSDREGEMKKGDAREIADKVATGIGAVGTAAGVVAPIVGDAVEAGAELVQASIKATGDGIDGNTDRISEELWVGAARAGAAIAQPGVLGVADMVGAGGKSVAEAVVREQVAHGEEIASGTSVSPTGVTGKGPDGKNGRLV